MTETSTPHPNRISDWTRHVGTVRTAIDTITAVSHNEPVDDAELLDEDQLTRWCEGVFRAFQAGDRIEDVRSGKADRKLDSRGRETSKI